MYVAWGICDNDCLSLSSLSGYLAKTVEGCNCWTWMTFVLLVMTNFIRNKYHF